MGESSRRAGYLKSIKPATWPQMSMIVVAHGQATDDKSKVDCSPKPGQLLEILLYLHTDTGDILTGKRELFPAAKFPDLIRMLPGGIHRADVWILHATDHLSCMGFWRWLDAGLLHASKKSENLQLGCEPLDGRGYAGIMLTADPPTLISCKFRGTHTSLRFMDVRNHLDLSWRWCLDFADVIRKTAVSGGASIPDIDCQEVKALIGLSAILSRWWATLRTCNCGAPQPTIGGQALRVYRETVMTNVIEIHDNAQALTLERDALTGGRNECYKLGYVDGPVCELDFNSHYLAVASKSKCPARLAGCKPCTLAEIEELNRLGYGVISRVQICTEVPCVPCRVNGITVFPTGEFWTTLCLPEIQLAKRYGCVVKSGLTSWYEMEDLFSEWTRGIWDLRQELKACGMDMLASWAKRLGVSLFGKFGQTYRRWEPCPQCDPPDAFAAWIAPRPDWHAEKFIGDSEVRNPFVEITPPKECWANWRSIGWCCQWERVEPEGPQSMPAITAWVYSLGRVALWEVMQIAGRQNVYYCDTDSLWCNDVARDILQRHGLMHKDKLGHLKTVGRHDWAEFYGLKQYRTAWEGKVTGFPTGAVIQHDGSVEYLAKACALSYVRHGETPHVEYRKVKTRISQKYRHGEVVGGTLVKPFNFRLEQFHE